MDHIPPHDTEAEKAVLGCMLVDKDAVELAAASLGPDAFYAPKHQDLFRVMMRLKKAGTAIDLITVNDQMEKDGIADKLGGIVYLSDLARGIPTSVNAPAYIKLVNEKAKLRRLIKECGAAIKKAFDNESAEEIALDLQKAGCDIVLSNSAEWEHISDVLIRVYEGITARANHEQKMAGIPTGFADLDEVISGLCPGDLFVLAGRPGMGKSSLAMNIAINAARKENGVAIISFEMMNEQLAMRILSSEAAVDSKIMKNGKCEADDYLHIADAYKSLSPLPIWFEKEASEDINQLSSAAMSIALKQKAKIIIVDYLQLMPTKGDNRNLELGVITRTLKKTAQRSKTTVILLSQMTRDYEKRPDKKPRLSDLRDSGNIEQDADIVGFLYREDDDVLEDCVLGIQKNRNGAPDKIPLHFIGEFTRFMCRSEMQEPPPAQRQEQRKMWQQE